MHNDNDKIDLSQSECLQYIASRVENYLGNSATHSIICADSLLFKSVSHPINSLAWLHGLLRSWLQTNSYLNLITGQRAYHRYILVPTPRSVKNEYRRRILRETTILYVHVQLWHGMVRGILFCDPHDRAAARRLQSIQFTAVTKSSVIFDTPRFHQGGTAETH